MRTLLLAAALLAGSANSLAAQSASDDFNRADSPNLGPDWVVDDGMFSIHANRAMLNNPWSLGFVHHATLTGPYADSYQSIDFEINGFGGDSVSLIAGLNPSTWSAIEVRLQDNNGDGFYDRLFFNSAVNAGTWDGTNLNYDLVTPIASGTMELYFTGSGDIAAVEITSTVGGTESFQGSGILTFTYPPTGSNYGFGGMGDSHVDNWNGSLGPIIPTYSVTNLIAGQVATLEVTNLVFGDSVIMAYSLTGAGPTNTPFGAVDMSMPINQLPAIYADAAGLATLNQQIPLNAAGRTIYTQAVVSNTGVLTNSLAPTVQ
jgi:hypothetical protein